MQLAAFLNDVVAPAIAAQRGERLFIELLKR